VEKGVSMVQRIFSRIIRRTEEIKEIRGYIDIPLSKEMALQGKYEAFFEAGILKIGKILKIGVKMAICQALTMP